MFFQTIGEIIRDYWPSLLLGIKTTVEVAIVGTVLGFLLGLLIGGVKAIRLDYTASKTARFFKKLYDIIANIYITVLRGTPMMVQSMVIFWGYAFMAGGKTLPLIPAGIFIVSINTGAYMAEIVRGGIISIEKGQFEGSYAVGMTHWQAMVHVIIPQALRNILPSISNEFVINIKDTSVLNVIGVAELYKMAYDIQRMNLKIFETYAIVCVLYFVLTFSVTRLLRFLEKKLEGSRNYTICGSQSDPAAVIRVKEESHG